MNTWPFVDDATGWRIDIGVGNDPSETWSLFMWYSEDQYSHPRTMFWLTNYWSTNKPSGMTAMFVTDGDFSFNAWEGDVEWPQARRDSGQAAAQWMAGNCGV